MYESAGTEKRAGAATLFRPEGFLALWLPAQGYRGAFLFHYIRQELLTACGRFKTAAVQEKLAWLRQLLYGGKKLPACGHISGPFLCLALWKG